MNRHLIALTFAMTLGLAACTTPISTPTPEGITEPTSSLPVQAPVETPVAQTPLEPDAQNVPFGGVKLFGGSASNETPFDAATDANGNVYVVGSTDGAFAGQTFPSKQTPGFASGFVMKINARGVLVWARIIGSTSNDVAQKVAVSNDGSVYVAGNAGAALPGKKVGLGSAFNYLTRFDANGKQLWVNQFGVAGSQVSALRLDSKGQPYLGVESDSPIQGVPGATGKGGFVVRGSLQGPFVSARAFAGSVALDNNLNVYVTTMIANPVPADPNADRTRTVRLTKYTASGSRRFMLEYPSAHTYFQVAYTVEPSGTVFLYVHGRGAVSQLARYDNNGKQIWTLSNDSPLGRINPTDWGTPRDLGQGNTFVDAYLKSVKLDSVATILNKAEPIGVITTATVDARGNIFLIGAKSASSSDVFVAKYNNSLVLQ
jgi:Beta-propeller repeat